MNNKPCARCGGQTPTNDNIAETTYWGFIQTSTTVTTERSVRVKSAYYRRNPRLGGSPLLRSDEEMPLCSDCSGLLIGRFLQGRDVPALPGKEGK